MQFAWSLLGAFLSIVFSLLSLITASCLSPDVILCSVVFGMVCVHYSKFDAVTFVTALFEHEKGCHPHFLQFRSDVASSDKSLTGPVQIRDGRQRGTSHV